MNNAFCSESKFGYEKKSDSTDSTDFHGAWDYLRTYEIMLTWTTWDNYLKNLTGKKFLLIKRWH